MKRAFLGLLAGDLEETDSKVDFLGNDYMDVEDKQVSFL